MDNYFLKLIVRFVVFRIEMLRLRFYKRNPLEKKALDVVRAIAKEERSIFSSPGELMNIWQQSRIMSDHGGVFAEVGVFRGTSAKVICESKGNTRLELFDTFSGLPDDVSESDKLFKKGMFVASESNLRWRLSKYKNVTIHKGIFPKSGNAVKDMKFSFVHLDVDLYSSTKSALEFFYPRMLPGGRILSHDYSQCEGVWKAFDEFIVGKPEKLLPMEETQVLLIKV